LTVGVRNLAEGIAMNDLIEFALRELTQQENKVLAYLRPELVWNYEYENGTVGYYLDTEALQVGDILQSWIYRDKTLTECSAEQYVQHRTAIGSEGIDRVEFSILVQQDGARIVWRWKNGRVPGASRGGTYVLRKVDDKWVEEPGLGEFWRT
jgi:hypothetical protein